MTKVRQDVGDLLPLSLSLAIREVKYFSDVFRGRSDAPRFLYNSTIGFERIRIQTPANQALRIHPNQFWIKAWPNLRASSGEHFRSATNLNTPWLPGVA
jgi:hypothetical protein